MSADLEISLPALAITVGQGERGQVLLEQDMAGTMQMVSLHRYQVRVLAEAMGILPAGDPEAQRTIARLCRQMRLLHERIDEMDDMLLGIAQKGHEDVTEELAHSGASLTIAREFVLELPDQPNTLESGGIAGTNPPKNGGLTAGNPPKSGGVAAQAQLPLSPGAST